MSYIGCKYFRHFVFFCLLNFVHVVLDSPPPPPPSVIVVVVVFKYLFILAGLKCGMRNLELQHVGSRSLTRDQILAPCFGSAES